jgi:flagellar hook-basal body complex protein FliE
MPVDKIVNPAAAAGAYSNVAKVGQGLGTSGSDSTSFGSLVKKAAENSIDTLKASEKVSADAVLGNATLTDVVEAVTSAEMTLQTVVAVRDRMMSAYQEIMRMPI